MNENARIIHAANALRIHRERAAMAHEWRVPLTVIKRNCLRCRRRFVSEHSGNRMCHDCRREVEKIA